MIKKLKAQAEKLLLHLHTLYEISKHPRTPLFAKILVVIALGYALSPIDLIPDFIPILGYLDDIIILPILLYIAIRFIPTELWEECAAKANKDSIDLPKNWIAAIIIILLWLLLLACILLAIYQPPTSP